MKHDPSSATKPGCVVDIDRPRYSVACVAVGSRSLTVGDNRQRGRGTGMLIMTCNGVLLLTLLDVYGFPSLNISQIYYPVFYEFGWQMFFHDIASTLAFCVLCSAFCVLSLGFPSLSVSI